MKLVKHYYQIDKNECWGLTDSNETDQNLVNALYEVEFLVDVDTGTIFAVDGKILSTAEDYEETE